MGRAPRGVAVTRFILRRTLLMILTLLATSVVAFLVIRLPPGDYAAAYVATLAASGGGGSQELLQSLRATYGLDQPAIVQYLKWMQGILTRGDFGLSFQYHEPVAAIIWDRVWLTAALSIASVLITWLIAFPIGIYSAVRQHSLGDYTFTLLGFVGISVPSFLLALAAMYAAFKGFGVTLGGLYSDTFVHAHWSLAKAHDLLLHIWLPVLILAVGGTAELIRIMRANLLDELRKAYVTTARAKGLAERAVVYKHALRNALIPIVTVVGDQFARLLGGAILTETVFSWPGMGRYLIEAIAMRDYPVIQAIILVFAACFFVVNLLVDISYGLVDPRVRAE